MFRELAKARSDELNRDYHFALGEMSVKDINRALEAIGDTPGLVLAEMVTTGRETLSEAVRHVQALLAGQDLDGPLTRWLTAQDLDTKLDDPSIDEGLPTITFNEVRFALIGGMVGGSVTTVAATGMANAGLLAAGATIPVFWPFVIGAAIFGGHQWWQRRNQRATSEARIFLGEVRDSLTREVVKEADGAAAQAAQTLRQQIAAALASLQQEVEADRELLAEKDALAGQPEVRGRRVEELDEIIPQAHALAAQANGLSQRLAVEAR